MKNNITIAITIIMLEFENYFLLSVKYENV